MLTADAFSPVIIEGTVIKLVTTFGRISTADTHSQAVPKWLKLSREMLGCQPECGFADEALALHAGKPPAHLAKAFRKAYGEPIGECQRRARLGKAESLLRNEACRSRTLPWNADSGINRISRALFQTPFGTTPAVYRAERF